jgi:hypothetical protein
MTLEEYLQVLDWTGREIRADKRGAIPADLQPILERLQVRHMARIKPCRPSVSRFLLALQAEGNCATSTACQLLPTRPSGRCVGTAGDLDSGYPEG